MKSNAIDGHHRVGETKEKAFARVSEAFNFEIEQVSAQYIDACNKLGIDEMQVRAFAIHVLLNHVAGAAAASGLSTEKLTALVALKLDHACKHRDEIERDELIDRGMRR